MNQIGPFVGSWKMKNKPTVVQMLPALNSGGVERGTVDLSLALVKAGFRSIVISSGGRLNKELSEHGAEHVNWSVGKKSLFTFRYVLSVRNFLLREKVDILHLRSRLPAWIGYLAWLSLPKNQRPILVTTVHGPYSVNRYSEVMTKGEAVIAVSNTIKKYVLENYKDVKESDISVVYRGIDTDKFFPEYMPNTAWIDKFEKDFPGCKDKKVILFPGRITRWKGHLEFVALIDGLKKRGQNIHGLVVGGFDSNRNDFFNEVKNKVRLMNLEDDITFTGDRSDIREFMAVSSIVTSLASTQEAFGRTVMEALSLGVPVVAYAHGGVKEQLDALFPHGSVDPGDLSQAVELIVDLLHKPQKVEKNNEFTLIKMTSSTLSLYQRLLQKRNSQEVR